MMNEISVSKIFLILAIAGIIFCWYFLFDLNAPLGLWGEREYKVEEKVYNTSNLQDSVLRSDTVFIISFKEPFRLKRTLDFSFNVIEYLEGDSVDEVRVYTQGGFFTSLAWEFDERWQAEKVIELLQDSTSLFRIKSH